MSWSGGLFWNKAPREPRKNQLRAADRLVTTVDSDGDGLNDDVEIHGFADRLNHRFVTLPDDPDTDGDGLLDGEEAGERATLPHGSIYYAVKSYPGQEDSDGDTLWDDEEYYYGTKPLQADSDIDGLDDGIDPHPLTFDYPEVAPGALEVVRIIIKGAVFGDMGDVGGWLHNLVGDDSNSPFYVVGAIVGGFIPISDLRDLFQSLVNLDLLGSMLNAIGFVPGPGDAVKISGTIGVFIVKHADDAKWIDDVIRVISENILKNTPDCIDEPVLELLTNNEVNKLRSLGFSWDEIVDLGTRNVKRTNINDLAKYTGRLESHGISADGIRKLIEKDVFLDTVDTLANHMDNKAFTGWSDGPINDAYAHLIEHYKSHANELGFPLDPSNFNIEVQEYFDMAVNLMQKEDNIEIYYDTVRKTIGKYEPSTEDM